MKKMLSLLVCILLATGITVAQSNRLIKGFVQTKDGMPIKGATIESSSSNVKTTSGENGAFEIVISPYEKYLDVKSEGFIPTRVEIESSYVVARLKIDKNYLGRKEQAEAEKARVAKQTRIEAEKKAEVERIAKDKAETAKLEAEKQAKREAQKKAEAERIAKEKAEAAKLESEKQAKREAQKRAEAERMALEKAEATKVKAAKKAEKAKLAKIAAEKRRKDYAVVQNGFGSLVDVSYINGLNYPFPSLGVNYIAGYRFNNQIYLGGGVGVQWNMHEGQAIRSLAMTYDSNFLNPGLISVPIFAYFKANFIDRRCSPFFAISVGGNFSSKQTLILDLCDVQYSTIGVFINPQLGINFRTTTKTSIYFTGGFQGFTAPSCIQYTGYNAMLRSAFGYGFDFHFGFTF